MDGTNSKIKYDNEEKPFKYKPVKVDGWKALYAAYEEYFCYKPTEDCSWIFRAEHRERNNKVSNDKSTQTKNNNPMPVCYKLNNRKSFFQTSLDKAFTRFDVDKSGYSRIDLERALIRLFQRKAHHYFGPGHIPEWANKIEWLALMQHYGAPTRLLDWFYPFWNAVFFAVARRDFGNPEGNNPGKNNKGQKGKNGKKQDKPKEYGEIWALKSKPLEEAEKSLRAKAGYKHLSKLWEKFEKGDINRDEYNNALIKAIYKKKGEKIVVAINSERLNPRLMAQHGTFLIQGNIKCSFDENFKKTINDYQRNRGKPILYRIIVDLANNIEQNKILRELNAMNINNATLMPDIEGFSEYLGTRLACPEQLGVEKKDKEKR